MQSKHCWQKRPKHLRRFFHNSLHNSELLHDVLLVLHEIIGNDGVHAHGFIADVVRIFGGSLDELG
jgi:hypothetical protein